MAAKTNTEIKKNLMKVFQIKNDNAEFIRLEREGIVVKDSNGKYVIGNSLANYIGYVKKRQNIEEVTAEQLAEIFGFAQNASIVDLAKKKIVVRLRKGVYDANKSSQNYIKHLKGNTNVNTDQLENVQELLYRKQLAQTQKEEEEYRKVKRANDIEEAKILPVETLIGILGPTTGQMNRSLENIAVEFKREFEDNYTQELDNRIKEIIDKCKDSIAKSHLTVIDEINKTKDDLDLIEKNKNSKDHRPRTTELPK